MNAVAGVFLPGPPIVLADGRTLRALKPVFLDLAATGFGRFIADHGHYREELAATGQANLKALPYVDRDFFGPDQLERMKTFSELLEPDGFKSFLTIPLQFEGEHFGAFTLFRGLHGAPFEPADAIRLRPLVPLLSMGDRLKAHTVRRLLPAHGAPPQLAALTAREQQVAELASQGLQNKAIAESLGLSPNTVRNVLAQVFGKLEVTTRTQLAAVLREAADSAAS